MRLLKSFAFLVFLGLTALGFAQSESLLIGPGDQVRVAVFDTPEMDQTVRVTDAGEIPLQLLGNVKISGMTPGQAAGVVEKALISKGLMLHPQVSISVEEFATQQVSVMGQVRNPGLYSVNTALPVLKVLSNAGGLNDVADRNITIQRQGNSKEVVKYFVSNNSDDAISNSVMVYPGDTVVVPKAGVIYVLGDVGKPGGYAMSNNASTMSVLEALANAGGANKTARVSGSKLIRKSNGEHIEVAMSLGAIQKGKKPDMPMQADDILYVPFSFMKNVAINGTQIAAAATSAAIYVH